jgi:hypothetical protein
MPASIRAGPTTIVQRAGEYDCQRKKEAEEEASDDSGPAMRRPRQGGGWLHCCGISFAAFEVFLYDIFNRQPQLT